MILDNMWAVHKARYPGLSSRAADVEAGEAGFEEPWPACVPVLLNTCRV